MSAPVWYTKQSNLGVIQEGAFYQFGLDARDPSGGDIEYYVVAGSMPDGIELSVTGTVFGQPKKLVKGVPVEVSQDVTNRFTVRAIDNELKVTDKTFSLTVTGQDIPVFTSTTFLGSWIDYQYINHKIAVDDPDTTDILTYEFISGELPPGVSITSDGYIRGFISPIIVQGSVADGDYDSSPYDTALFDSGSGSASYSYLYRFVTRVTDGKAFVVKEFSFYVFGGFDLNSDVTTVTVDNSGTITADNSSAYSPVILHTESDIGSYLHDNRFNFKVDAVDYSTDTIVYSISNGSLPDGLQIDSATGWIYGKLPVINVVQQDYNFTVKVQKLSDPDNIYFDTHDFKLTVTSNKNLDITWNTPVDLGNLTTGEICTINISAVAKNGSKLNYEILPVTGNRVPQGLQLLPSGDIQGQVSFKTFLLDGGTTTMDKDVTTVDGTYFFTVRAIDNSRTLYADRQFKVRVINFFKEPYENVYINLLPKAQDRIVWENMVFNNQDIPESLLYRSTDIYFGIQKEANMLFLSGMTATGLQNWAKAVYRNHYTINLRFGEFAYAKAQDSNGNHIYDVVYVNMVDTNEPPAGLIANTFIQYNTINNEITVDESAHIDNQNLTVDSQNNNTLYPARLSQMRTQVQSVLDISDSRTLPAWMTSVQDQGRVIGYTPACVIAYVKPGEGERVLYYLNINNNIKLNEIEYTVDRYTVDGYYSRNYNKTEDKWLVRPETTFDRFNTSEYTGDGSTTVFQLQRNPVDDRLVYITINGIAVPRSDFTISGNTVTFNTAPLNATTILLDDTSYLSSERQTTIDGNATRLFAYTERARKSTNEGNQ